MKEQLQKMLETLQAIPAKTFKVIYTPVVHERFGELVQICNDRDDNFVGWADGAGKYDRVGTWEISDSWSQSQNLEYGRHIQTYKETGCYSKTENHENGISRIVTLTI